jgi:hypothetical protein
MRPTAVSSKNRCFLTAPRAPETRQNRIRHPAIDDRRMPKSPVAGFVDAKRARHVARKTQPEFVQILDEFNLLSNCFYDFFYSSGFLRQLHKLVQPGI